MLIVNPTKVPAINHSTQNIHQKISNPLKGTKPLISNQKKAFALPDTNKPKPPALHPRGITLCLGDPAVPTGAIGTSRLVSKYEFFFVGVCFLDSS